jgi:hypothetical protein
MVIEDFLLGLIGAITGILSLGFLIYKTWKEKPGLKVEVRDCHHWCQKPSSSNDPTKATSYLYAELIIHLNLLD